jgi:hypothetical protein
MMAAQQQQMEMQRQQNEAQGEEMMDGEDENASRENYYEAMV